MFARYYMFHTDFKMIRQFHVKIIFLFFFSQGTRALLLTTYVKFINLFPEIKTVIEDIFKTDSNLRSSDAELQQRACEYLALSKVASLDVLATVLEEMPPFPEKESSGLLNLLKKKRPGAVPENPEIKSSEDGYEPKSIPKANVNLDTSNTSG